MARRGSGRSRKSKSTFLDLLDTLTLLGIRFGGAAFVLASGYLLWGLFSGSLEQIGTLAVADQKIVWTNIFYANQVLSISGPVLAISLAIRYYAEEIVGYLLLLVGAALYWGLPTIAASVFQTNTRGTALILYTISQFGAVATIALLSAAPLILIDLWFKLKNTRQSIPHRNGAASKDEVASNSYCTSCWKMPYCRDYLRKFCKPYSKKKTCWRIKSGCYCDENLILRAIKSTSSSDHWDFDQKFSQSASPVKNLTPFQKRERCRKCFIYSEHQKQKYRLLSPLPFVAVFSLIYIYYKSVSLMLYTTLTSIDKLVARFSFLPKHGGIGNQLAISQASSGIAEWLLLICICLIAVTYLLRFLEYLMFDLQV